MYVTCTGSAGDASFFFDVLQHGVGDHQERSSSSSQHER
jgi:hypothetical protein